MLGVVLESIQENMQALKPTWKRSAEAEAVRDYFQVEDEEGTRFWLYRRGDAVDGRTGDLSWHVQGMFG